MDENTSQRCCHLPTDEETHSLGKAHAALCQGEAQRTSEGIVTRGPCEAQPRAASWSPLGTDAEPAASAEPCGSLAVPSADSPGCVGDSEPAAAGAPQEPSRRGELPGSSAEPGAAPSPPPAGRSPAAIMRPRHVCARHGAGRAQGAGLGQGAGQRGPGDGSRAHWRAGVTRRAAGRERGAAPPRAGGGRPRARGPLVGGSRAAVEALRR